MPCLRLVMVLSAAIYLTAATCPGSGGILTVGDTFSDGPGEYESDEYCSWTISLDAPGGLAFTLFRLEDGLDELKVLTPQNVRRVISDEETPFVYSLPAGNSTLIFESDPSFESDGFEGVVCGDGSCDEYQLEPAQFPVDIRFVIAAIAALVLLYVFHDKFLPGEEEEHELFTPPGNPEEPDRQRVGPAPVLVKTVSSSSLGIDDAENPYDLPDKLPRYNAV